MADDGWMNRKRIIGMGDGWMDGWMNDGWMGDG
jgi:hypothetical protein